MSQQLAIPATKTSPPRLGVPLIQRPRLFPTVQQAHHKKLLVLSAEAGYGKTSLLLSALPQLPLPTAWLTLDEVDTDLNLFAAGLVGALRAVIPEFGEEVLRVLTTGPNEIVLRRGLLRALEELPETLVVLDDFHAVDQSAGVQDLVDHLLVGLPHSVHVIIATRTWPRLHALPRLLVAGEALVLDKSSLGFSADEVTAFFQHSHGLQVGEQEARLLTQRTEGWPAALQLFALASKTRGTLAVEGTPQEIFDYLATTVLDALPDETQEFVLCTSLLSELWPALCGALVGQGDPAAMLETLDRGNLFLYRLDESGTRYRYHQLFAEFLRQRLARRGAEAMAALHRRAGQHLEEQGINDQAVRHYLAAGAYADAERVMKPLHGDRLTARLAYVFRETVSRLPEGIQTRYPWITRAGASSARFVGDYQGALTLARRAMAAAEHADPNLWTFSAHGVAVMYSSMDRYEEAVALCRLVLPRLDDRVEPRMKGGLLVVLADCHIQLGEIAEAERVVADLPPLSIQITQLGRGYGAAFLSGLIASARLEHARAREHFRQALQRAEERGSLTLKTSVLTETARVEITAGNTPAALATLQEARALHEQTGERATDLTLTYLTGDAHLLAGDPGAAEHWYQQALAKCREGESQEPRMWAYLGLARVARARGRLAQAESLLSAAMQICERIRLGKAMPRLRLEQLSLLRETGRPEAALALLPSVQETFARWDAPAGLARCGFFEARLRWDASIGQPMPAAARAALQTTLRGASASPEDILPFLRVESAWTVPLLILAMREQLEAPVAERLLTALGPLAVEHLLDALKDPTLRLRAIRLLGHLGDPRARRPLARLLSGHNPAVRSAAEAALALLREPEPVTLRIHLLGHFGVFRSGEQIEEGAWKTQKVKALLKYLLLHRDHAVPQDQLVEVLWPESDPRAGSVSLKVAVKILRQALEPLLEGTRSHFIHREGHVLRFRAEAPCWVDLDEYRRLLDEARRHEVESRPQEAIRAYEAAVALYRGDLLGEDLYEDWAALERERWREAQINALAALARLYAGRRDYGRAVERIQQVLALDRLRETAYRDLMHYSLLQGDRQTAIRAFRTCEQLLREELGVAPQPETAALHEQARAPA